MHIRTAHCAFLLFALLAGCAKPTALEDTAIQTPKIELDDQAASGSGLEHAELGSTRNVHRWGNVFFAGQPEQDDLETVKEQGVNLVIDLRREGEIDWDEAAEVQRLGMEYQRVPVGGPNTLTDDVFEQTRKLLREAEDKDATVLLHCGSATRVGAVWLAHRVLDHGVAWPDALEEAKTIGLHADGYVARAEEYVTESASTD